MSSVQTLREFINERLTAAAGEIFTAVERTIIRYEEEIDRECKHWGSSCSFQIKLDRTESPQLHSHNQGTPSSLDQEEHEPPHIKKEEEDLVELQACYQEPYMADSMTNVPSSGQEEKEVFGDTSQPVTELAATPGTAKDDDCLHIVTYAAVSSLNHCEECRRKPISDLKWLGFTCQLCSQSWHKSCFFKRTSSLDIKPDDHVSSPPKSRDDCVPCSSWSTNGSSFERLFCTSSGGPAWSRDSDDPSSSNTDSSLPHHNTEPDDLVSSKQMKEEVSQSIVNMKEEKDDKDASPSGKFGFEENLVPDVESSDDDPTSSNAQSPPATAAESFSDVNSTAETAPAPKESSCTKNNYCYVCKTPQSKISRHLKKHEKEEPDIAEAFSLPKHSKERKKLLEKLRNKGNYEHNQEVLTSNDGLLKVKRRSKQSKSSLNSKTYVHCVYCKGMFIRKELWRHSRRCPSKTASESQADGKVRYLPLADIAETTSTQAVFPGVWKLLKNMRQDEVASVVRNDFLILQLSQSLYDKHGNDPSKFEYMRQRIREMGRLLLTLKKNKSIFSFEDATKPKNFNEVIAAVKSVAGYNEEKNCYHTPSLARRLGRSLKTIGDIIVCRAIAAENEQMIKVGERFTQLCAKEWIGLAPHTPLAFSTRSKFIKPPTLPFTEDVQLLHQYLEKKSADAVENLKKHQSPQTYAELARLTLAHMIVLNRHHPGKVSKITLESFEKRDQTELHEDVADSLSQFEQKLAKRFSRAEIMDKGGRKVAVLLHPEVVSAATLLAEKRHACDVHKDNSFLFGRPQCSSTSLYSGLDCIRKFASECGAKNPEYLMSERLRKHVATLSLILNLKDNELDQLASFVGHDIRVRRDFLRQPEATIEMARISRLLLAMENGSLAKFQGKSFDEIEVEDVLDPELDEGESGDGDSEGDDYDDGSGDDESDGALRPKGKRKRIESAQNETTDPKEKMKRMESTQDEAKTSTDAWTLDI